MTSKNTQNDSFSHQDWTQVVLKKSIPAQKKSVTPQSQEAIRANKIDNGEITIPTSSLVLQKQIQQARTAKGMTQNDLNVRCNFPKNTVQQYENGNAVVNMAHVSKMSKILGVKLIAPKPKKIKSDE